MLIDDYARKPACEVNEPARTGCGNGVDIGYPLRERDKIIGKGALLAFTHTETTACTGCGLCAGGNSGCAYGYARISSDGFLKGIINAN
ncbi:MAG: hypothetical protein LBP52_03345 [Burkholderiaceae bacterium]|nr:hypothetical protein [Burkholderiaceae bacterium]